MQEGGRLERAGRECQQIVCSSQREGLEVSFRRATRVCEAAAFDPIESRRLHLLMGSGAP